MIGGGIIGASTAAALARSGISVVLLTEGALGSGASGRSIAWLNSAGHRSAEYHALRLRGLERYRAFAPRLPDPRSLRFDGGLRWGAPARRSLHEVHRHELSIGYPTRWLAIGDPLPDGVEPAAVVGEGAIFNPDEGWVDLPAVISVLEQDLLAAGGEVLTNVGACRIVVRGGRAVGVEDASGAVYRADVVVLATGAQVPSELARLGVVLEEQTTASVVVVTEPADSPLAVVLNTPRVAVRRTPRGGLVLDSAWSEREVKRHGEEFAVPRSTVDGLVAEARRVLLGAPELRVERVLSGLKPIPGDGEPAIGPVSGVEGLHIAFTHSGATLGLIVGELFAEQIADGVDDVLLSRFAPRRLLA